MWLSRKETNNFSYYGGIVFSVPAVAAAVLTRAGVPYAAIAGELLTWLSLTALAAGIADRHGKRLGLKMQFIDNQNWQSFRCRRIPKSYHRLVLFIWGTWWFY